MVRRAVKHCPPDAATRSRAGWALVLGKSFNSCCRCGATPHKTLIARVDAGARSHAALGAISVFSSGRRSGM